MGSVAIPASALGTTLNEADVKSYLIECNETLHFDVGSNLNIWHPYQEDRQGVWYRGRHICSMDRDVLPEVPIWTVRETVQRVPTAHLSWGELSDPFTMHEYTVGPDGKEVGSHISGVRRKEKHKIIRVGWRHTFGQILKFKHMNWPIPGITKEGLERRFGIDLSPKLIEDPPEVIEKCAQRVVAQNVSV